MRHSINPLKWLVWLFLKVKWRKSPFQRYHCPEPLSKEGKAEMTKMLRAAVIRHDFIRILREIYMDKHVWHIQGEDGD